MKRLLPLLIVMLILTVYRAQAQQVRETVLLDKGWKFSLGHAGDPKKDFGCGTEYFNYLTKASSIHNEGPYSLKFDDTKWQDVQLPHDWVTTLPYAAEASHSHGYKTVGWKYPESSVGWYRKQFTIPATDLGKRLMLRFDGIFRNARVWFNGFYMGTEPSGYCVPTLRWRRAGSTKVLAFIVMCGWRKWLRSVWHPSAPLSMPNCSNPMTMLLSMSKLR